VMRGCVVRPVAQSCVASCTGANHSRVRSTASGQRRSLHRHSSSRARSAHGGRWLRQILAAGDHGRWRWLLAVPFGRGRGAQLLVRCNFGHARAETWLRCFHRIWRCVCLDRLQRFESVHRAVFDFFQKQGVSRWRGFVMWCWGTSDGTGGVGRPGVWVSADWWMGNSGGEYRQAAWATD